METSTVNQTKTHSLLNLALIIVTCDFKLEKIAKHDSTKILVNCSGPQDLYKNHTRLVKLS